MTTILTKEKVKGKSSLKVHDLDLTEIVKSASRVIAPLWPISRFAARHPWMGLEGQSFEQVARWMKETREVDIYPSVSILKAAQKNGDIDLDILEMRLQRWLHSQTIDIPYEEAERFCRGALQLEELSSNQLEDPNLHKVAEKLDGLKLQKPSSIKPLSTFIEQQDGKTMEHLIDYHLIKWCKLYLGDSQSAISMPFRDEGFYRAWRKIAIYDPSLNRTQRLQVKNLPLDAMSALKQALMELKISPSEIQRYLEAHLLALPGWAGMVLWQSQQSNQHDSLLMEYLAIRICLEWVFIKPYLPLPKQTFKNEISLVPLIAAWTYWGNMPKEKWLKMSVTEQKAYLNFAYCFDEIICRKLWLEAWEETYKNKLKKKISRKLQNDKKATQTLAQFVFCIDVRSEPIRRALEKVGNYETYGMAGFFGLPIETCELGEEHVHPSLPVILKPQHRIKEMTAEYESKKFQHRLHVLKSFNHSFKKMKQNLLPSLILPELSGPWYFIKMLTNSFVPRTAGQFFSKLMRSWLKKPSTDLSLDHVKGSDNDISIGFTEKEKVHYARQALKMMGLTNNFAPLVVICGHGSKSKNNPYASALDCGACGGASGGFNARVLATLCNLPNVRSALSTEGMIIPDETVFVAAEHITTLDEIQWLYVPKLSEEAQKAMDHINESLPKVSLYANQERVPQLPNFEWLKKDVKTRATTLAEDWSEVRPEWGLARNAAFIIGSRELTKECNLEGRVFLHNYHWEEDQNGDILANIISGPGTVTQWINLQYYASTVAPHFYGSGNKTTQTVTAGFGVMQGNASDLLSGLPWQSVMKSDYQFYHAPLRLLVVIQAPQKYVERLLDSDSVFRQKVQNEWMHLASIDEKGVWKNWS